MSKTKPNQDPAKENIRVIAQLEQAALHDRSLTDRISDRVTRFAGSGAFIFLHVLWFVLWLAINNGVFSEFVPFDPFPYTFLTMVVSLEAIFLSIFVLISQNRMNHQADRRAHLDLQVDLLAEQEMTLVLRMLQRLCEKMGVEPEEAAEMQQMFRKTDLHELMGDLQQNLPEG